MREKFQDFNFKPATLEVIGQANTIIREYQKRGFTLTLRQLYYQFVSRDIIPNKMTEYKRLGKVANNARLAGLIDWSAIHDRTRNLESPSSWSSPAGIISAAARSYQENPWEEQAFWPEVWIEKDALVGVIEDVCEDWRVPYFACRGYTSQSEQYTAGKRLEQIANNGKVPVILHLGDHDPSGIDMTRDNEDRLSMFADMGVEVRRLALNMDQVDLYNPPPNPAKATDSRFEDYARNYGQESWELDALDPDVIADLISEEVKSLVIQSSWDRSMERESQRRDDLNALSMDYDSVMTFLNRD